MNSVSFKTLGCRLNQAETAQMRATFETAGYSIVPYGDPSDICVIHGCAVTARAEKECLRFARAIKRKNPTCFVVITGCASEVPRTPGRTAPGADLIVRQKDKYRIPAWLATKEVPAPAPDGGQAPALLLPRFDSQRAIVKVQDGCEFRCAYCIVPLTRGPSISRPLADIVRETRQLVESGYPEIVLTGANIGCYRDQGRTLMDILEQLEALPLEYRLRLSSLEMSTVEQGVIDFMAHSRTLCRFLHLPLQSGSDTILKSMGRRYTTGRYRALIDYACQRVPHLGLGSDVLVGFPGETDADFAATLDLLEQLPLNNLHIFGYSPRPGTLAAARPDPVHPLRIKERVQQALALADQKRQAFGQSWIGQPVQVLVETVSGPKPDQIATGWTGEYVAARISGQALQPKSVVTVIPDSFIDQTLYAKTPSISAHFNRENPR